MSEDDAAEDVLAAQADGAGAPPAEEETSI